MPIEAANPFAQAPTTPEPIIAQVRRQLADDAWPGLAVQSTVLDRVADRAVRDLWESPVKTFVPVLALRQAREVLREQWVAIEAEQAELRPADELAMAVGGLVEMPHSREMSVKPGVSLEGTSLTYTSPSIASES